MNGKLCKCASHVFFLADKFLTVERMLDQADRQRDTSRAVDFFKTEAIMHVIGAPASRTGSVDYLGLGEAMTNVETACGVKLDAFRKKIPDYEHRISAQKERLKSIREDLDSDLAAIARELDQCGGVFRTHR